MKIKILSFFALLSIVISQTQIAGASPLLQTSDFELSINYYAGTSSGSPYQTNSGSVVATQPNPYTVVMDTTFKAQDNVDWLNMGASVVIRVGVESVEDYPINVFFYTSDGLPVNVYRRDTGELLANSAAGFVTIPSAMTVPYDQLEFGRYYETSEADVTEVGEAYTLYIFAYPYDPCEEDYISLTSDTYEIDPIIELPLGPEGAPADDQIYPTVTGEIYKIRTDGGPWNDGTTDRDKDTSVSWDGETWTPFDELVPLCVSLDGETIYIEAESETYYIRVDDTEGDFADNTNNPDPVTYTIDLVTTGSAASCESQYTYDPFDDLVGFTGVDATSESGVLGNNAETLVVGEWYIVRWDYDTWQDEGSPPDRIDLEYQMALTWADLAEGSKAVWCASSDGLEVLFQADSENVYLRVNNDAGDFTGNTGNPFYSVYHVAFTRTLEGCETTFRIGDLIEHRSVQADQSGGAVFASMVGGSELELDAGLTPGAWYVVDTTDGPWWQLATNPLYRYDMAVSEDNGDTWGQLEDWTTPVCNIPLDTLGHRRMYFQMPSAGEEFWKLRVDGSGFGWFVNRGSMEWDLYGVTQYQDESLECDYSYDEFTVIDLGTVNGNNASGVPLDGMGIGEIYAIKIVGTGYGWQEGFGGEDLFDMQISHNGGTQYYNLPDEYPAALCSEVSGDDLIVYVQPGENYNYRLRVDSTTFNNNTGKMGYVVYPATAGPSIENTCLSGYSLQSINEFDWIDVRSETGEVLGADTARYEEFIALVPGRVYMVETPVGQGPWGSFDDLGNDRWDTALSKDNGATWQELGFDNTDIDCADRELVGNVWKARFTVEEGDVWKIRVNDEAGAFANNSGNMAYKFWVLCEGMACTGSVPNDGEIPAISVQGGGNVCTMPVMRPQPLTVSEIFDLGNYVGSWLQYVNLSVLRYMAWCPKHTNMFISFMNKFKEREPFATIQEWDQSLQRTKQEIESYDWGDNAFQDTSIFDQTDEGALQEWVYDNFFAQGDSIWNGGDPVEFGDNSLPASYYSCDNSFTAILPSSLKSPVCFVSAWFIESSASFWVQLSIDIGAIALLLGMIKDSVEDVVYMMTGVKPWVKSSNRANWVTIEKNMSGDTSSPPPRVDADAEFLSKSLGGNYERDRDGSYRRRW